MIEKIFNVLFSKNKKVKCLTLVKDRQSFLTKKSCCENKSATTCLSEYFVNRKGLNKTVYTYNDRDNSIVSVPILTQRQQQLNLFDFFIPTLRQEASLSQSRQRCPWLRNTADRPCFDGIRG